MKGTILDGVVREGSSQEINKAYKTVKEMKELAYTVKEEKARQRESGQRAQGRTVLLSSEQQQRLLAGSP